MPSWQVSCPMCFMMKLIVYIFGLADPEPTDAAALWINSALVPPAGIEPAASTLPRSRSPD